MPAHTRAQSREDVLEQQLRRMSQHNELALAQKGAARAAATDALTKLTAIRDAMRALHLLPASPSSVAARKKNRKKKQKKSTGQRGDASGDGDDRDHEDKYDDDDGGGDDGDDGDHDEEREGSEEEDSDGEGLSWEGVSELCVMMSRYCGYASYQHAFSRQFRDKIEAGKRGTLDIFQSKQNQMVVRMEQELDQMERMMTDMFAMRDEMMKKIDSTRNELERYISACCPWLYVSCWSRCMHVRRWRFL